MRFKTKQDVADYLDCNFEAVGEHNLDSFIAGATWMINMKSEEVEALKDRIRKLTNKMLEDATKITDYEMLLFGSDVPKKKGKKISKEVVEREQFEPLEEMMIEDEDNDSSYYE